MAKYSDELPALSNQPRLTTIWRLVIFPVHGGRFKQVMANFMTATLDGLDRHHPVSSLAPLRRSCSINILPSCKCRLLSQLSHHGPPLYQTPSLPAPVPTGNLSSAQQPSGSESAGSGPALVEAVWSVTCPGPSDDGPATEIGSYCGDVV